ncbi:MAG: OmpH family outer membrane protein [Vicinamibacterales bacterium]
MIRALTVVVLAFSVSPASAQDTVRVGAVSLAYVARSSKAGKSALAEIEKFVKQKESEAATKALELEQQRLAMQKSSAGLNPRALADLQKAFDKSRLDFDRFQQDTRAELEGMQARFDAEFRIKLAPIIDAVSKEKGLYFVFGLEQAAIMWWSPAVDISEEVVKRLDGVAK